MFQPILESSVIGTVIGLFRYSVIRCFRHSNNSTVNGRPRHLISPSDIYRKNGWDIGLSRFSDNGSTLPVYRYSDVGWLVDSFRTANKRRFFRLSTILSSPPTLCVTVCHHVAHNTLFYNRINACNFATDKETDRCNRWKSQPMSGKRPGNNLTKENSCSSEHSKLCFSAHEINFVPRNNLPLARRLGRDFLQSRKSVPDY